MEFTSPIKNPNGTTTVNIETIKFLKVQYQSNDTGSHNTPSPDSITFKRYIGEIAMLYENYSKKWFTRAIMSTIFLSKLMHTWKTEGHPPYMGSPPTVVNQEWCPEQLIVNLQSFTIIWKLQSVNYTSPVALIASGPVEITFDEIPHDSTDDPLSLETTLRSRALRKVRQARLIAAVSKARADSLSVHYYEKYGNLEELDSNSVLSSDSE